MGKHNTERLEEYRSKLVPGTWYSGAQLDEVWGLTLNQRKHLTTRMVKLGLMRRKGMTTNMLYRINNDTPANPVPKPKPKPEPKPKPKPKPKPTKTSALDVMVNAASELGTENELLKQALREIDAIIAKAREFI